jgi:hypothetical protein
MPVTATAAPATTSAFFRQEEVVSERFFPKREGSVKVVPTLTSIDEYIMN